MGSFQQIIVIGNMGKDPRDIPSEKGKIAGFTLAESYWDFRDKERKSQWYDVVCFGRAAQRVIDRCVKGSIVAVTGQFRLGEYEGKPRVKIEAADVEWIGGKKNETPNDDIPF